MIFALPSLNTDQNKTSSVVAHNQINDFSICAHKKIKSSRREISQSFISTGKHYGLSERLPNLNRPDIVANQKVFPSSSSPPNTGMKRLK
jgi:hypothetical protein